MDRCGAADRLVYVAGQVLGRVEESMDGIADDLVDHAAMPGDERVHLGEIDVEQGHEFAGTKLLRNCRETLDIGEKRRHRAFLTGHAPAIGLVYVARHHGLRQILREFPPGDRLCAPRARELQCAGDDEDRSQCQDVPTASKSQPVEA